MWSVSSKSIDALIPSPLTTMIDYLDPICTPCRRHGFSCERDPSSMFVQYRPKKKTLQIAEQAWPCTSGLSTVPTRTLAIVTDEQAWFAHLHATISSDAQSVLEEWTGWQAASYEPGSLVRKSLVALSCSFFGRSNNSTGLMQWGNEQYMHCLREVNVHLDSPVLRTSPGTLLAVAIFGYYEVREFSRCSWMVLPC